MSEAPRSAFVAYTFAAEVQTRRPMEWPVQWTALNSESDIELIYNHSYVHPFRLKELGHLEHQTMSLLLNSLQLLDEHISVIGIPMDKVQHYLIVVVPLYVSS